LPPFAPLTPFAQLIKSTECIPSMLISKTWRMGASSSPPSWADAGHTGAKANIIAIEDAHRFKKLLFIFSPCLEQPDPKPHQLSEIGTGRLLSPCDRETS
jgi:hypothetical protein